MNPALRSWGFTAVVVKLPLNTLHLPAGYVTHVASAVARVESSQESICRVNPDRVISVA